uniref:Putative multi antimicrobial extrusion protein n=1 Tax=Helianthus annuus TaxID=4232 RepID=A0A251S142_HELAN
MDDGMQARLLPREEEEGELTQRIWDESKRIWRVALPGIISRVSTFGTIVVTQSFIGHINDIDLAGYALVQTLSVRFINGILFGVMALAKHSGGGRGRPTPRTFRSVVENIVRVANELGRGNAKAVRFSIQVLLGTSIAIGVFFFVLCLLFGKKLAYLFTDDERVADTVLDLYLLLSFSVLLNFRVAIGGGMQGAVAIVNLVCYYLIGIPLGALLGYTTSLQVKGIWIGMIGGVVTQTISLAYMNWRTNWDDEVKKASECLGRFYLNSDENSDQISN